MDLSFREFKQAYNKTIKKNVDLLLSKSEEYDMESFNSLVDEKIKEFTNNKNFEEAENPKKLNICKDLLEQYANNYYSILVSSINKSDSDYCGFYIIDKTEIVAENYNIHYKMKNKNEYNLSFSFSESINESDGKSLMKIKLTKKVSDIEKNTILNSESKDFPDMILNGKDIKIGDISFAIVNTNDKLSKKNIKKIYRGGSGNTGNTGNTGNSGNSFSLATRSRSNNNNQIARSSLSDPGSIINSIPLKTFYFKIGNVLEDANESLNINCGLYQDDKITVELNYIYLDESNSDEPQELTFWSEAFDVNDSEKLGEDKYKITKSMDSLNYDTNDYEFPIKPKDISGNYEFILDFNESTIQWNSPKTLIPDNLDTVINNFMRRYQTQPNNIEDIDIDYDVDYETQFLLLKGGETTDDFYDFIIDNYKKYLVNLSGGNKIKFSLSGQCIGIDNTNTEIDNNEKNEMIGKIFDIYVYKKDDEILIDIGYFNKIKFVYTSALKENFNETWKFPKRINLDNYYSFVVEEFTDPKKGINDPIKLVFIPQNLDMRIIKYDIYRTYEYIFKAKVIKPKSVDASNPSAFEFINYYLFVSHLEKDQVALFSRTFVPGKDKAGFIIAREPDDLFMPVDVLYRTNTNSNFNYLEDITQLKQLKPNIEDIEDIEDHLIDIKPMTKQETIQYELDNYDSKYRGTRFPLCYYIKDFSYIKDKKIHEGELLLYNNKYLSFNEDSERNSDDKNQLYGYYDGCIFVLKSNENIEGDEEGYKVLIELHQVKINEDNKYDYILLFKKEIDTRDLSSVNFDNLKLEANKDIDSEYLQEEELSILQDKELTLERLKKDEMYQKMNDLLNKDSNINNLVNGTLYTKYIFLNYDKDINMKFLSMIEKSYNHNFVYVSKGDNLILCLFCCKDNNKWLLVEFKLRNNTDEFLQDFLENFKSNLDKILDNYNGDDTGYIDPDINFTPKILYEGKEDINLQMYLYSKSGIKNDHPFVLNKIIGSSLNPENYMKLNENLDVLEKEKYHDKLMIEPANTVSKLPGATNLEDLKYMPKSLYINNLYNYPDKLVEFKPLDSKLMLNGNYIYYNFNESNMKHMYLLVLKDREDNKLRWVILDLQEQKIYDNNFDLKESDLTYDNCIAYISEDDSIENLLKNITLKPTRLFDTEQYEEYEKKEVSVIDFNEIEEEERENSYNSYNSQNNMMSWVADPDNSDGDYEDYKIDKYTDAILELKAPINIRILRIERETNPRLKEIPSNISKKDKTYHKIGKHKFYYHEGPNESEEKIIYKTLGKNELFLWKCDIPTFDEKCYNYMWVVSKENFNMKCRIMFDYTLNNNPESISDEIDISLKYGESINLFLYQWLENFKKDKLDIKIDKESLFVKVLFEDFIYKPFRGYNKTPLHKIKTFSGGVSKKPKKKVSKSDKKKRVQSMKNKMKAKSKKKDKSKSKGKVKTHKGGKHSKKKQTKKKKREYTIPVNHDIFYQNIMLKTYIERVFDVRNIKQLKDVDISSLIKNMLLLTVIKNVEFDDKGINDGGIRPIFYEKILEEFKINLVQTLGYKNISSKSNKLILKDMKNVGFKNMSKLFNIKSEDMFRLFGAILARMILIDNGYDSSKGKKSKLIDIDLNLSYYLLFKINNSIVEHDWVDLFALLKLDAPDEYDSIVMKLFFDDVFMNNTKKKWFENSAPTISNRESYSKSNTSQSEDINITDVFRDRINNVNRTSTNMLSRESSNNIDYSQYEPVSKSKKFALSYLNILDFYERDLLKEIYYFVSGFKMALIKTDYKFDNFTLESIKNLIINDEIDLDEMSKNMEYERVEVSDIKAKQLKEWLIELLKEYYEKDQKFFKSIFKFWFSITSLPQSTIKLSIYRKPPGSVPLPQSHTCYNILDLYDYESKDELRDKLEYAIKGQQMDRHDNA